MEDTSLPGYLWALLSGVDIILQTKISQLVGALSPVNHKGLHQGRTQTSLYLQVIHFTSHQTTSHVFFNVFIFHRHSTRESASGKVTYFILQAYTEAMCKPQPTLEKSGEVWEKKAGEWTRRVEISKEEIPGSKCSMYGYILIYSRL